MTVTSSRSRAGSASTSLPRSWAVRGVEVGGSVSGSPSAGAPWSASFSIVRRKTGSISATTASRGMAGRLQSQSSSVSFSSGYFTTIFRSAPSLTAVSPTSRAFRIAATRTCRTPRRCGKSIPLGLLGKRTLLDVQTDDPQSAARRLGAPCSCLWIFVVQAKSCLSIVRSKYRSSSNTSLCRVFFVSSSASTSSVFRGSQIRRGVNLPRLETTLWEVLTLCFRAWYISGAEVFWSTACLPSHRPRMDATSDFLSAFSVM
mmetsp:Transcript_109202/g.250557  ORF Transcript_109202/g.250557 Transcript_109202/m.250557 type:complete len:259 (+) Transcript_109202:586-1362(+)